MKTAEVLDKYRKVISGLLDCKEDDLHFVVGDMEIKEIVYFEPEKDNEGNETGRQVRQTRWSHWSEGRYKLKLKDKVIATWELYKMPHCCAIIVSCKAFVDEKFRGKRLGTTLNNLRQDIGRLLGYSLMMCTDISQNTHQRQLLKTNGWKDVYDVVNRRTTNRVYISVINL